MEHHHNHNHSHAIASVNKAFIAGILLNAAFVAAEFTAGIISGSMSLLSDAGHNLSDIASLILAML
ncbi:MAG: cation transporter, partial [Bacteroidales bacterium]|nr:cation transporter [Bacteroidales bacterium]MDD4500873.1 cation transporter [Bacteroidales bacterium]